MKNNYEKQFFNKLSKQLDKFFPKGKCAERDKALVLNAYANIVFREMLKKAEKKSYEQGKSDTLEDVDKLLIEEMNIANSEGTPTSPIMKIKEL